MTARSCLAITTALLLSACGGDDPAGPAVPRPLRVELRNDVNTTGMRAVIQVGSYAYAALYRSTETDQGVLLVYDLGGASAFEEEHAEAIARLDLPGNAGGLAHKDGHLFIGCTNRSVVVDIADPTQPRILDSVQLVDSRRGVRLHGNRLLLFNGNYLRIYDVSDPTAPVQTHASDSDCWSGDVHGDLFAMGQSTTDRVLLYDVSVAGTFSNFAQATLELDGTPYHARNDGESLYVQVEYFDVQRTEILVYDLSRLEADGTIAQVDRVELQGLHRAFALDGTHVLAAAFQRARVFRRNTDGSLAPPTEVQAEGIAYTSGFPFYGDLQGQLALLPGEGGGLVVRF